MLTKVRAYSQWQSAPTLLLAENGRPETDLIQVRNIDGLDPVKAAINTSPFGSIDGVAFTGADVPSRNIVLTLHPNPDWDIWTFESLRRLIYKYFMPKQLMKLDFYSDDDFPPVGISGYVESCDNNPFTKDPEILVSIVCPDPYFTALDETVITGISGQAVDIDYVGDIETGINLIVTRSSDIPPVPPYAYVNVQNRATDFSEAQYFQVDTIVDTLHEFMMNTLPGQKLVQSVALDSAVITNLLSKRSPNSAWITLTPGTNTFSIQTGTPGHEDFRLSYYARFGGL